MNELVQLRKITMIFEEIYHEGGPPPARPLVRAAILAVARNPYAGQHVEDVLPYMEALTPLGLDLSKRLVDALGGDADLIESYGEGAIVGTAGEIEHAALWDEPGAFALRETLGAGADVPSTKKVGAMGARLDVPIAPLERGRAPSHLDAMEVGVPDGPRPDEIVFVLAMTAGGRIHPRAGGLEPPEMSEEDRLR